MEDREFFDHIYQMWAKTTGASNMYWQPVEHDAPNRNYSIDAVDEDQSAIRVAAGLSEEDADFLTAVHGCFADLIRRLGTSLDEADRLDEEKDGLIVRIADLEQEAILSYNELERSDVQIASLTEDLDKERATNAELLDEIRGLESELSLAYEFGGER